MEREGVISSVSELTEWCAPMVPVIKKLGDVRICVNLKYLNESFVRPKFVIKVAAIQNLAPPTNRVEESSWHDKLSLFPH